MAFFETDGKVGSLLEEYGKELGLKGISLEELIRSHRALRNMSKVFNDERRNAINKAYEDAYNKALNNMWVKLDDLRKMSVQEMLELLRDD